jgi:hypothetical protein
LAIGLAVSNDPELIVCRIARSGRWVRFDGPRRVRVTSTTAIIPASSRARMRHWYTNAPEAAAEAHADAHHSADRQRHGVLELRAW